MLILFQYQPGPAASYCEIGAMLNGADCAKGGGRPITGVSADSVWDRSTTRTAPDARAAMRGASASANDAPPIVDMRMG